MMIGIIREGRKEITPLHPTYSDYMPPYLLQTPPLSLQLPRKRPSLPRSRTVVHHAPHSIIIHHERKRKGACALERNVSDVRSGAHSRFKQTKLSRGFNPCKKHIFHTLYLRQTVSPVDPSPVCLFLARSSGSRVCSRKMRLSLPLYRLGSHFDTLSDPLCNLYLLWLVCNVFPHIGARIQILGPAWYTFLYRLH